MNNTITIGSGEEQVSATTTEEKMNMFIELLDKIVEIKHPVISMRTVLDDGLVGYFGYMIWSNDGGKTITINPTYLDVDEDSELKKWWDMLVSKLLDIFHKRWGYLSYVDAENEYEIYKGWCDGVYKNWINN